MRRKYCTPGFGTVNAYLWSREEKTRGEYATYFRNRENRAPSVVIALDEYQKGTVDAYESVITKP